MLVQSNDKQPLCTLGVAIVDNLVCVADTTSACLGWLILQHFVPVADTTCFTQLKRTEPNRKLT